MNPRYRRWRWISFGITWLIYAAFYFTRQAFGMAKVQLARDPRVSMARDDMGVVDSVYLTTYMLGQFLFGPLGDRFGPRLLLLSGMALSVVAAVCSGFSTTLAAFVAFAILQGVAQSTGWSNTSKVISNWFTVGERGRIVGWWCTHYTVGAAAASAFAGFAMKRFGTETNHFWPLAFWSAAAVLAIVFVLSVIFLRGRPEDVGLPPIEEVQPEENDADGVVVDAPLTANVVADGDGELGSWALIGQVLSKPSVWLLALSYFPIKLARYCFYFWGPIYISESLGGDEYADIYATGLTTAAMPIGGVFGVITLGYVSDKLFQARRAPATVLSILATAAIMFVGLWPIHNIWVMGAFFFFVGVFLFGPDSMISATAAMDFGTKRGAGTATGFINGVGSIGAILGGYLPGKITTADNWTPIFYVMLGGLIASALTLVPLWRAKPPTS